VAKALIHLMHQDGFARAVIVVVLDPLGLTDHCVINFHGFKRAVAVKEAADTERNVEGVSLCRNSHEMLDEINEKVFVIGWVTDSVNVRRRELGGTLLLALKRFGFDIDQTLKQVKIAEQGFVANAVSPARLSARKPADGNVVQPLALARHRDIQLECGGRDDPRRNIFILVEKVSEAIGLVQPLLCGYSVHCCVPATFS